MSSLNLKIVDQQRPSAEELAKGEAGPKIAEAAFYVYGVLGPGLDESVYRECFAEELTHMGVPFTRDTVFPVAFRGKTIEQAFRADFLVGGQALVFVIAEEKSPLHNMQIRSLLKISGKDEAYIVNFRVEDMSKGIMRATVKRGNVLLDAKAAGSVN